MRHWISVAVPVLLAGASAWYAMMIVHEFGHVLGAWASGGRVVRVVVAPLAFSRTDVTPNPHPLVVVWSGPVCGALVPLVAWFAVGAAKLRLAFLARFFAGFCLIANGVYLASAALVQAGDTEEMLRFHTPLWAIVIPGLAAFAGGLALWNGLGASFGLGGRAVDRAAIPVAAVALVLLVGGMLVCSCAGGRV